VDRRTFLGVAGLSVLAIAGRSSVTAAAAPSSATRWAMVIDPRKCLKDQGCTDCIGACDKAHNVPHLLERAREVKWIWREPFDKVFPDQSSRYTEDALKKTPVLVFCNHCDNPP